MLYLELLYVLAMALSRFAHLKDQDEENKPADEIMKVYETIDSHIQAPHHWTYILFKG